MTIKSLLAKSPILPVLTIHTPEHAVPLANALHAGGIHTVEVVLRTPAAPESVELIKKEVPEVHIGIGTIVTVEQMHWAKEIGAVFTVSPGSTEALLHAAKDLELPFLPGVVTASEVMRAHELGYEAMKLFPANLAGGSKALKNFGALFPQISFCPTGGVNQDNLAEFASLSNVIAIGGSWLAPQSMMEAGDWQGITKLAEQAIDTFNNLNQ